MDFIKLGHVCVVNFIVVRGWDFIRERVCSVEIDLWEAMFSLLRNHMRNIANISVLMFLFGRVVRVLQFYLILC